MEHADRSRRHGHAPHRPHRPRGIRLSDLDRDVQYVIGYVGRRWELLAELEPDSKIRVVAGEPWPSSPPAERAPGGSVAGGGRAPAPGTPVTPPGPRHASSSDQDVDDQAD